MRIIQLIDSLDTGGAERMAVNYANALANVLPFSALVTTRKEGSLKLHVDDAVDYLFLNRQGKIGIAAIFRLKSYCRKNQVTHIHAHGSSFFTGFLLKLIHPKMSLIWHDHYGLSEFLEERQSVALKISSFFFSGIISVNSRLEDWALQQLHAKTVIYLPNFTATEENQATETVLKGTLGKRIVCLANLREQKDHFLLLAVADKLKISHPEWTFHFVGKDFKDVYSHQVKEAIISKSLSDQIFVYGSKNDTSNIIGQSDIAVLSSKSEGLPVALLEYGMHQKAVVVTAVGEMPLIIQNNQNGCIVASGDVEGFYEALLRLVTNNDLRKTMGIRLRQTILDNHSETAVIAKYLNWIKNSVNK